MSIGIKDMMVAAQRGDAGAQFNLGVVYDNRLDAGGVDNEANRIEAIKWLGQAAHQGLARAQTRLAELYADGSDQAGAYVQASTWFILAAGGLQGAQRQRAQSGLERLCARMLPSQIEEAKSLAKRWVPSVADGDGVTDRAGLTPLGAPSRPDRPPRHAKRR